MGHDIIAQNKTGEMIASLRYTMWDVEAYKIYELLDVEDYNGGVSGIGIIEDFTKTQIEKALQAFNKSSKKSTKNEFEQWQQDELREFLTLCLKTTEKEETVNIYFG